MPTRRSHQKSRNGCKTCRTRRVKCDERRPVCKNCERRGIECVWSAPVVIQFEPVRSAVTDSDFRGYATSPEAVASSNSSLRTGSSTPRTLSVSPSPAPTGSSLDLPSLSLLHHYMSSTYATFGPEHVAREAWRTGVSRLATTHPFLMHLLLAVSALHLSFLDPSAQTRYELIAASHYCIGSQALRETISRRDPIEQTAEESAALFAGSGLLMFYVVASPQLSAPRSLAWFPLMKGIRAIMGAHGDALRNGELGALVGGRGYRESNQRTPESDSSERRGRNNILPELPDYLSTIHLPLSSSPDAEELDDPEVGRVYQTAVDQLKEMQLGGEALSVVFVWPGKVPTEFMEYVLEKRGRALVILAHYCALAWPGVTEWWMKGQVREELDGIGDLVEERWKGWMEWPREVVKAAAEGMEATV